MIFFHVRILPNQLGKEVKLKQIKRKKGIKYGVGLRLTFFQTLFHYPIQAKTERKQKNHSFFVIKTLSKPPKGAENWIDDSSNFIMSNIEVRDLFIQFLSPFNSEIREFVSD